jgi:hypothetical protein
MEFWKTFLERARGHAVVIFIPGRDEPYEGPAEEVLVADGALQWTTPDGERMWVRADVPFRGMIVAKPKAER